MSYPLLYSTRLNEKYAQAVEKFASENEITKADVLRIAVKRFFAVPEPLLHNPINALDLEPAHEG